MHAMHIVSTDNSDITTAVTTGPHKRCGEKSGLIFAGGVLEAVIRLRTLYLF